MTMLRDSERRWLAWTLLLGGIVLLAVRPLLFRPPEPRPITWKELVSLIDGREVTEAVMKPDRVIGVLRASAASGAVPETVAAPWSPDIDRPAFVSHVRGQGIAVARRALAVPESVQIVTWVLPLSLLALLYLVVGGRASARLAEQAEKDRRRQAVPSEGP